MLYTWLFVCFDLQRMGYDHQEIITPELYCGFTKTPPITDDRPESSRPHHGVGWLGRAQRASIQLAPKREPGTPFGDHQVCLGVAESKAQSTKVRSNDDSFPANEQLIESRTS
jgi:hypothetical protein